MNLTDFENSVATRIQDSAQKLKQADIDDCINQAVKQRYSKDRPRQLASDVAADGTTNLPLPQGPSNPPEPFEDGFSVVSALEFPIGGVPPSYIENEAWQMYRTPSGLKIMLTYTGIPSNGDHVRVTWTARHLPGTSGNNTVATTVPDADFEAVSDLASSLCCEKLAAQYAQTRDASIQADSVNYRTKSQEYLQLAKTLRQRYLDHVGIEQGQSSGGASSSSPAAMAMGDMELRQGSGIRRITHGGPR